jgi:hypothetical protein
MSDHSGKIHLNPDPNQVLRKVLALEILHLGPEPVLRYSEVLKAFTIEPSTRPSP